MNDFIYFTPCCSACNKVVCECEKLKSKHQENCQLRIALITRVECIHGWDVCPQCDPCTCDLKIRGE